MMDWTETFTVTEEHIKLLQKMWVGWNDCEFGAPEIDPKRPYGNSNVIRDIHEILCDEIVRDRHDEVFIMREQEDRYNKLHSETQNVLQILIHNLSIQPGTYSKEKYSSQPWTLIDND